MKVCKSQFSRFISQSASEFSKMPCLKLTKSKYLLRQRRKVMKNVRFLLMKQRDWGFITSTLLSTTSQFMQNQYDSTLSRLTLDLDNPSGWRIYEVLAKLSSGRCLNIEVEYSRNGIHIICITKYGNSCETRLKCGDDSIRAYLDLRRPVWARNILFQEKRTFANSRRSKTCGRAAWRRGTSKPGHLAGQKGF